MAKPSKRSQTNTVRIIGGEFRGRKLTFPDVEGLRPTSDRIRETLFNWLQRDIPGARCLDLFSGSGALGLEALSRGAKSVQFVDQDSKVCRQIEQNLTELKIASKDVFCGAANQFLAQSQKEFDIVFLDPPFQKSMLQNILTDLVDGQSLHPQSLIYLEAEFPLESLELPQGWELVRNKKAGAVHYGLLKKIVN